MSMPYRETFAAHVRLCLLRLLDEAPGREANSVILHDAVLAYGLKCSRDSCAAQIAWLAEQELVTTRDIAGVVIVTLTARGQDAAHGRAIVPGVRRPGPET
ncbi:MAG: ArsR family transcriptional regulator [Sinobacteraceae bacterium]|nr:ArsR family transcriptional regulator [Nevskiaceae bacterium]